MTKLQEIIAKLFCPDLYAQVRNLRIINSSLVKERDRLADRLADEKFRNEILLNEVQSLSSTITEQETINEDLEDQTLRLTAAVRGNTWMAY